MDYFLNVQEEYKRKESEEANRRSNQRKEEPHGKGKYSQGVQYVKKEKPKQEEHVKSAVVMPKLSREQSIENLRNAMKEIILAKIGHRNLNDLHYTTSKELIYQLTRLIDGMTVESITQCEFLSNFGISLSNKKYISLLIQNNGEIIDREEMAALELKDMLIIYKYLDLAVKKMHKEFIKFELADINEDLLFDFKKPKSKAVEPKMAVDYRDALKPKINFEDDKSFPELKSATKQKEQPGKSIWQQMNKPLIQQQPKVTTEKGKREIVEEFPAFPGQKEAPKEELKKIEVKKEAQQPEYWPSIQEVNQVQPKSEGGSKKKKKNKKEKPQVNIELGFN